jgi:hypothetical protein
MGMRTPLRMVGGIFAAFDCRALPGLIRVRELFRAFLSRVCDGREPLRASGLSGTARPHLAGIFPQLIGLRLVGLISPFLVFPNCDSVAL